MLFQKRHSKAERGHGQKSGPHFRLARHETLEARLYLHEGDGPWLDHYLDDTAALNELIGAPANTVAQVQNAAPAVTGTPATVGQWGPLQNWPVEFIEALMLPTGKVLGFDRTLNLRLWDPVTNAITEPSNPGYNIFCSGISLLADGTALVTGGHVVDGVGQPFASIYNPFSDTWSALPNMNAGRWYPANTTLANGDVLVLSGTSNSFADYDPLPQVYDVTTGKWIDLTTALQGLPYYPRTFSAPNGDAFVAGPQQLSEYLDTSGTGLWTPVANRVTPDRNYGSAVMYAPGKVLYVGGGSPATNTAEIIDLNQPNPTWQAVSPMAFARRNCNATLLPDGEVLVTGGNTGSSLYDGDPVMAAEIWNPQTKTFTTLPSEADIRWYHSTALLLPDGRVVSGSGDLHLTEQIYSPAYLFNATQPTITSAPGTVRYGDSFFVATPDATSITNVRWIRMGTSTHAQNWDQYLQDATFTQTSGGLMVSAPPTPNSAPPGYYYLFILKGNVPSVAKIIKVGTTLPTLSVGDTSVTEANTGVTTNAVFKVSLSQASAQAVTVAYSTSNGTALAGTNYAATSGTLTFAALATSQTVTIPVKGDGVADPNETFNLNLSAPVGATVAKAQGQGLIRDFNSLPVLQIQGASVVEGNSGTTNANFVVTLSAARTQAVTVRYTTVNGTATTPSDYAASSGTLTFSPGATQQTITVAVVGDTTDESNETYTVQLSSPVGATLDIASAQGVIVNDDTPATANIPTTGAIVEPANGGTAGLVLTATLSAPSGKTVVIPWITTADGTAIAGTNFVNTLGKVTFTPGVTAQTFTIPVLGDSVKTPNETFSVQMQSELLNGNYGNRYTEVTITNSDLLPAVSLANASVTEGNSGTVSDVFTATLSAASSQAVTVVYQTSAGTATAGTDYTQASGTLTFAAGATTSTLSVSVKGDTLAESNETFNVALSSPVGATIAVARAVGTIVDDDSALVPAAPTNLAVTAGFASAFLSWQASTGATSYSIYRSTNPNGEGTTPVATGVSGTTFSDSGLVNGKTYYYRVTAVHTQASVAYESTASSEASIVPDSYNFSAGFINRGSVIDLNGENVENVASFGSNLQLTDGGTHEADSAFTLNPVNITRFTTQFALEQAASINYTSPLGGGLTFTIQNAGATALGSTDAGLGYAGIGKSVAVKFDLTSDAGEGPDSTGLYTNGAAPTSANSVDLSTSGIDLHSGHPFNVGMSYDGTTLSVTITDTITLAKATQSYTVNIPGIVGGNTAYVGFTASTELLNAVQAIPSWTFTPAPSAPANLLVTSGSSTPVNLTWTNTDPNSAGVLVERKTGASGTYAQIGSTATAAANTFSDATAVAGVGYTYRVRAVNGGSTSVYSNEVSVNATAPQAVDLQITNSDGQTTAAPGSAITYTIVVTNAGTSSVTGAAVADAFPATLTSVTYTATATGGATGFTASGSGSLSNTVTMPAGSTIVYTVHGTVSASATGTLTDTATVAAPAGVTDTNIANNSATDTDTLTSQFDLRITNSDGQTVVAPGAAVTYTIVVTNASSGSVTGASVKDTFPSTLKSATYTATATGGATGFKTSASGNLSNTVTMPAGSTITYVVHATLNASATGSLTNTATVTAPSGVTDSNTANNSATDTDTIATPTINFPSGFTGATSQFSFNGSSAKIVGSSLQLTTAVANQAASIYARTAVNVAQFNTQFSILQANGTNPSADGMTFVLQAAGLTALGGSGGNLGYGGINKSVAIKFDLYSNVSEGPDSTGLYTNGPTPPSANSVNLTGTGIDLHSGHVFNVSMNYDGTTLAVSITDATTLAKATQSYTVNIPSILGASTAYAGFTGATGGLTATQTVLNWVYTPVSAPGGLAMTQSLAANLTSTTTSATAKAVVVPADSTAATPTLRATQPSNSLMNTIVAAIRRFGPFRKPPQSPGLT